MIAYYLYGSLVWGDFDIESSDIDTLCVLSSEVTPDEIEKLRHMHDEIVHEIPKWKDRIEVHYASLHGLKNFRRISSKMGNISPGEPLHIIGAGIEWLDEWYCVQEYAITLFGIDKSEVIPPIETSEFIQTICGYARSFKERIKTNKNNQYSQAYAILTLCRVLYTLKNEEQVSKLKAAHWVMNYLPEYSNLIRDALEWRHNHNLSAHISDETLNLVETFVNDVIERFFTFE